MTKELTDTVQLKNGGTVSNRLVQSPMQTWSGEDRGFVTQDTIDYYDIRSESAGLIITEYAYVSEEGGPARTGSTDDQQLGIIDNEHAEGFKRIAEVLKKDGNKAVLQIAHAGREANYRGYNGERVVAPSKIDFSFLDYEVEELSENEILEIIEDFADTTKRAIDIGYDGVEIHGANHYLLQQFFSEFSNHRTNQWGGSLENRMRFSYELTKAVFEVVEKHAPDNFIVGYRISPEEVHGDTVGYTYEESLQLIEKLDEDFSLDYIHLSLPKYDSKPENSEKIFAELFGKVINDETKLMIVGDVMNEADAEDALQYTDLVAVGRATLVDPEFGKKIVEGRGDEIITEIYPEQVQASKLPDAMVNIFSTPDMEPALPGAESIYHLHKGGLDESMIKDGTGTSYNIDE